MNKSSKNLILKIMMLKKAKVKLLNITKPNKTTSKQKEETGTWWLYALRMLISIIDQRVFKSMLTLPKVKVWRI